MKKTKEFNNILDECLERLLVKGESIEQCLASYPEQATELGPLLQTSLAAKKASAIKPRPEFREKARYQFHAALREMEQKRRRPFFSWSWQPRWAATIAIVLVLVLGGGSTVAAAGNSMPDSPLYQVKLATETVRVALTPSTLGKAELHANLADKRVAEIIYMADKGKPEQVKQTTQRLNTHLTAMVSLAAPQKEEAATFTAPPPRSEAAEAPAPPGLVKKGKDGGEGIKVDKKAKLKATLSRYAAKHPDALRAALERAPASVKTTLRQAVAISETSYEQALQALD
jgi:hypothetical protein